MPDWINPLFGWLGLGGVGIAGLLALAWFFPPFRKLALMVAGVVAAALAIYTKGSRDAARRKQAEWDKAEGKMVDKSNKARADAERDHAAGRLRGGDEFDRDRG
ncbi:MAG: hypothetical protein GEU91_18405 [Rhizobiales bacterium]|nr:hypothetical protein [Hyphomicrobiales bacterium]